MTSKPVFCLMLFLFSGNLAAESIVLISDLNGRYGNTSYDSRVSTAIEVIQGMQPALVISTGDMVAGQKQPRLDQEWLDRMWQGFNLTVTQPLTRAGIPFVVTPGNHDGSAYPQFALEQERFDAQWRSRVPELEILPGSDWPRRYAARMGDILLLSFDGTRPGKLPSKERQFIEQMLEAYGNTPGLTIVFSHLPMWPISKGRESQIIDDPLLLSMLQNFGVDVYASGHHHAFFAGTDDAGMIHLSIGALGGNARAFSGDKKAQPFSFAVLSLEQGTVDIRSRIAPAFQLGVPEEQLPATLSGPLGVLQRIDGPVPLRP